MVMTLRECHEGMKDLARHLMAELGALTPMIVGFEKYTDRRWVFAVSVASPEERRMSIDETRDRLAEHNCDRYSMIDTDRLIAALPELLVLGVLSTGVAYALQAVAQQFTSASEAAVLTSAESVFGALGGMLLLAERPTLATALGASLIALAILAVQYRVSLLAATSRVQRALRSTGLDPSSASSLP